MIKQDDDIQKLLQLVSDNNNNRIYDGKSFLPVWEYIAKVLYRRYGRRLRPDTMQDLISHVTVRMLEYWFEKYDPAESSYCFYADRGIRFAAQHFFRKASIVYKMNQNNTPDGEEHRPYLDTVPAKATDPDMKLELEEMRAYILKRLPPGMHRVYRAWMLTEHQGELAKAIEVSRQRIAQCVERFRTLAHEYRSSEREKDLIRSKRKNFRISG